MIIRMLKRALAVSALLVGLGLLLGSGAAPHHQQIPPTVRAHRTPTLTPSRASSCPAPRMGFVVVFSRSAASDAGGFRCFQPLPKTDPAWSEQVLATPLTGVYEACASEVSTFVAYASHQNPALRTGPVEVDGNINLFVPAGTCRSVPTGLGVPSITMTSIIFVAWFSGSAEPFPFPIHQVSGAACSQRTDFFTVWYDEGRRKACFANFGYLHLPTPLTGVVRVCSGKNQGEVYAQRGRYSGFEMGFGYHQCATPAYLFGLAQLSLNAIDIG